MRFNLLILAKENIREIGGGRRKAQKNAKKLVLERGGTN